VDSPKTDGYLVAFVDGGVNGHCSEHHVRETWTSALRFAAMLAVSRPALTTPPVSRCRWEVKERSPISASQRVKWIARASFRL
jgi:hypothetical protein